MRRTPCATGETREITRDEFVTLAARYQGDDCLVWPFSTNARGHGVLSYRTPEGKRTTTTAHRAVLIRAEGPPPDPSMYACHEPVVCHNPPCVNPKHLRWATPYLNAMDQLLDRTGTPVLWPWDVDAIRASGETQDVLARRYGVSQAAISQAKNGVTHCATYAGEDQA